MATAKKPATKKPLVIKTAPKTTLLKAKAAPEAAEKTYSMPVEVKEWIDQANSRIKHLTAQNERLKAEIADLKRANKNMERRVMGSEA